MTPLLTKQPLTSPRQGSPHPPTNGRRTGRPSIANSFHDRGEPLHEENANAVEPRPAIRSNKPVLAESPVRDSYASTSDSQRPVLSRNSTFEGPTQLRQDPFSGSNSPAPVRTTSENLSARINQLRPVSRVTSDPYVDQTETYSRANNSYDGWTRERSASPTSYSNGGGDMYTRTSPGSMNSISKKGPPPPPPSRAKKPPPPPPMKRPILAGDAY